MASRRKRKRVRRAAEATARPPQTLWGWGEDAQALRSELALGRQAFNQSWDLPLPLGRAIVATAVRELDSPDQRIAMSALRTVFAALHAPPRSS